MKNSLTPKAAWSMTAKCLLLQAALLLIGITAFAQQRINGRITDDKGYPLSGATIQVKGTKTSTQADKEGLFTITTPSAYSKLIVTNVGFKAQEIAVDGRSELTISLSELSSELNQVVVTGVFDKRKRLDASIAISTINAEQIRAQAPVSAADLLKNVPGVYVNSSTGEIRNQVIVRGTPIQNDVGLGYFYVSMQEDGLPVTNLTGYNFGPDYYLRADATVGRVEAVRGGAASITGSDAPGGLFNYVSKTGGTKFSGEVRAKYGLEGDNNPFYRADFNMGGSLSQKGNLTYNIGGFYRYSDGARYAGYPLNKGGQFKGNIVKKFANGSLKLYAKYMNDRNGFFDFLPFTNFENPRPAPGFSNTNTFAGPGNLAFDFRYTKDGPLRHFNPKDLIHNLDRAIGLDWQQNLGNGWTISNNIKYSSKSSEWNTVMPLGVMSADGFLFYYLAGALGRVGTYTFTDLTTGKPALTVRQDYNVNAQGQVTGVKFTTVENKLPNNQVQSAPLLLQLGNALHSQVRELMDQFVANKKIGKSTFTVGAYYGRSSIDFEKGFAGTQYSTLENRPHPIGLTYTASNGATTQYTNPQGWLNTGSQFSHNILTNNRMDLFFGQSSPLSNKLTLDYGFRYNYNQFKGTGYGPAADAAATAAGGYDNNPSTRYDNAVNVLSAPWTYNKIYKSLSFSGALNYKFSDKQAVYGRYSLGRKAPDLQTITAPMSQKQADALNLEPINVTQAEIGFKSQSKHITAFVTPFYSKIGNLPSYVYTQDTSTTVYYYTPNVYSEQRTIGVELEGIIDIGSHFNIRAVGTIQNTKSIVARSWDVGKPGSQDDKIIETRNGAISLTPNILATITPTYKLNKLNTFLSWRYVGKQAANPMRAFYIPGYSQLDMGIGYQFTTRVSANVNINNLYNSIGVTGWYPPGGFPSSLDPNSFTAEKRAANPNAVWGARTTLPRAYYLTVSYNL
jgi:iron complex outermembrane recepter protein